MSHRYTRQQLLILKFWGPTNTSTTHHKHEKLLFPLCTVVYYTFFWTKMHVAIYIICHSLLDNVRYSKENALNHLDMVVYCQPSRFTEPVIFDTS